MGVIRDREMGRFPTSLSVTRFAIAAIVAMRELAAVLVFVAIQTARERHRSFEILGLVTVPARHGGVLAEQRIVGAAVVETVGRDNLLPTAGDMAAGAIAAERVAVRIFVARRAVGEHREALVLHGRSSGGRRSRPVALIAIQPDVQTREGIERPIVREAGRILPGIL